MVVMLWVCDVVLLMLCGDVVCDGAWDVVCEWWWMLWYGEINDFMLLWGFGDWQMDEWTEIGGCRVTFTTENHEQEIKQIEKEWILYCQLKIIFPSYDEYELKRQFDV